MAITLSILDQFLKCFRCCKKREISNKIHISLTLRLKCVAALPWETSNHLHGHISGDIIDAVADKWRKHLRSPGMCPCKWWTF